MTAEKLDPGEVTELCTAAQQAWEARPARSKKAEIIWCGKNYVVTSSPFRLLVDTPEGKPVACRWH
ncbi:hypothetical protein [Sphingomonas oryzagri]